MRRRRRRTDMPNIGPMELLVILVLALIVVGPNRLPEIGRSIGRALREFRRAQDEVRQTLRFDLEDEDEPPRRAVRSSAPPPPAEHARRNDPVPVEDRLRAAGEEPPRPAAPPAEEGGGGGSDPPAPGPGPEGPR
ncbi:MAG TPA: twin-arginine translocase TatA/TatE family subunit [Actinomycetota bacterium]|nr:twin-arginine translocase TatA/TatE family subunit [Actinomycetota bacterium]